MQAEKLNNYNHAYEKIKNCGVVTKYNNELRSLYMEAYGLTIAEINDIENSASTMEGLTIHNMNHTLYKLGYKPLQATTTATETTSNVIPLTTIPMAEEVNENGLQISENVTLNTMEHCQQYWNNTKQTNIVIPSRVINATKKPPISTLTAISILSAKEGGNTIDNSGKGARIMNTTRIDKLYKCLTGIRTPKGKPIKPSTITTHIKKLQKLKSNEFQLATLKNEQGTEGTYYKLDYSEGFVLIDLRVLHYMLENYEDSLIQAYIILLWNCREGWAQLTREQMAVHMGLTEHSDKQTKKYMDTLVSDGFIETREQYQAIKVFDKVTGLPKSITKPYYEYKIVNINEL